jgi:hypothetical protein
MLAWVTAPFSGLIILYIISKLDDYLQWKKMEKEMIEDGESEADIAKAKKIFLS